MRSIRLRLLLIQLVLFLFAWSVVAVVTFFMTRHEVEELFDAQLAQSARVILDIAREAIAEREPQRLEQEPGLPGHKYEKNISFQIWKEDRLILRSASAPSVPMARATGFSDQRIEGAMWRIFVLPVHDSAVQVQAGESYAVRNELIHEIARQVLYPLLLSLPLLAILIWMSVRRGLLPVGVVAREVAERSPRQLAPVDLPRIPTEIRPLVDAINTLLARLEESFSRERRFTADAAHELRTPLASVRVQMQVALAAVEPAERSRALRQAISGVDRASRLVEQLLTLARLDPDVAAGRIEETDLPMLIEEVAADLTPSALEKGLELGLSVSEEARVSAVPDALTILIRNLVDNAIRYTPAGGRVELTLEKDGGDLILNVDDTGPGIPAELMPQMLERFARGEAKDSFGCGLGLSIVQRIAELHEIPFALETSPLGGLRARMRFSRYRA